MDNLNQGVSTGIRAGSIDGGPRWRSWKNRRARRKLDSKNEGGPEIYVSSAAPTPHVDLHFGGLDFTAVSSAGARLGDAVAIQSPSCYAAATPHIDLDFGGLASTAVSSAGGGQGDGIAIHSPGCYEGNEQQPKQLRGNKRALRSRTRNHMRRSQFDEAIESRDSPPKSFNKIDSSRGGNGTGCCISSSWADALHNNRGTHSYLSCRGFDHDVHSSDDQTGPWEIGGTVYYIHPSLPRDGEINTAFHSADTNTSTYGHGSRFYQPIWISHGQIVSNFAPPAAIFHSSGINPGGFNYSSGFCQPISTSHAPTERNFARSGATSRREQQPACTSSRAPLGTTCPIHVVSAQS